MNTAHADYVLTLMEQHSRLVGSAHYSRIPGDEFSVGYRTLTVYNKPERRNEYRISYIGKRDINDAVNVGITDIVERRDALAALTEVEAGGLVSFDHSITRIA